MKKCCKNCKFFNVGFPYSSGSGFMPCYNIIPFPERGCSDFVSRPKKFVLIHRYNETGFISIVGFSDDRFELFDIMHLHPRYGSSRHDFFVFPNPTGESGIEKSLHPLFEGMTFNDVKDSCLINICKNVAQYLSIGEYAMLKKSYFKASAWFEKAKNSSALGADIIDNY